MTRVYANWIEAQRVKVDNPYYNNTLRTPTNFLSFDYRIFWTLGEYILKEN